MFKYKFVNNNLVPEMVPTTIKGKKAVKLHKKLTAIINVDGKKFQADTESINFMSSTLAISNFNFNKLLAAGKTPQEAFDLVYNRELGWKDAENKWTNVTVDQIGGNLEKAMYRIKDIISE